MTKDEALKLALEALVLNNAEWKRLADSGDSGDWSAEDQDHYKHTEEAITAIKEALAQPEQEPVAWCVYCDGQFNLNIFRVKDVADVKKVRLDLEYPNHKRKVVPLYTSPPQRKPLTDEHIGSCIDEVNLTSQYGHHHFGWHKQFARAIEAAHNIKGEA